MSLAAAALADELLPCTGTLRRAPFAAPRTVPAQRGEIEAAITLRHAGNKRLCLRWETQGDAGLPAVVVLGGISATRHVASNRLDSEAGWWECQVGAGLALDPAKLHIIGIDWVGADGDLDAPIDTADQAEAVAAVLDALGIARLHAFVGCSYGAMVGLAFAANHDHRVERLVAISGAHKPHPFASAWRGLQRKIVALGQLQCAEDHGLSLARQLAMLSYRTPEEFAERFDAPVALEGQRARTASDDYLEACGLRYTQRWSATAFLRLSESIDLHSVDPALINTPTTVIAVAEDRLVPLAELRALSQQIAAPCQLQLLNSLYGHDAFLKETDTFDALLRASIPGDKQ